MGLQEYQFSIIITDNEKCILQDLTERDPDRRAIYALDTISEVFATIEDLITEGDTRRFRSKLRAIHGAREGK